MNDTVNSEFVMDSFDADFELLLTGAGFDVLVEGVELGEFDTLDGVRSYVLSIVEAVRDGVRKDRIEARVDSAYGRRVPRKLVLKLIMLLRSHGVQLKRVNMSDGKDILYWGVKTMK